MSSVESPLSVFAPKEDTPEERKTDRAPEAKEQSLNKPWGDVAAFLASLIFGL